MLLLLLLLLGTQTPSSLGKIHQITKKEEAIRGTTSRGGRGRASCFLSTVAAAPRITESCRAVTAGGGVCACACARACVCVCVCERERERMLLSLLSLSL